MNGNNKTVGFFLGRMALYSGQFFDSIKNAELTNTYNGCGNVHAYIILYAATNFLYLFILRTSVMVLKNCKFLSLVLIN